MVFSRVALCCGAPILGLAILGAHACKPARLSYFHGTQRREGVEHNIWPKLVTQNCPHCVCLKVVMKLGFHKAALQTSAQPS